MEAFVSQIVVEYYMYLGYKWSNFSRAHLNAFFEIGSRAKGSWKIQELH
jgi:hypothetical protein